MLDRRLKRKIDKAIQAAQADVLTEGNARVDRKGSAVIPQGTRRIGYSAFEGNKRLRRAVLPDTVKSLSDRAFAGCENLEQVQLNEGLLELATNVFNGCSKLKSLVLPDSLKETMGYSFWGSSFQSPVFNRSQTVLHYYPSGLTEKTVAVPAGVKRLAAGAFFENTAVEEVILPEGLETIDTQAFLEVNLRRITIPASVSKIEAQAFWDCPELEEVELLCPLCALMPGAFYRCPKVRFRVQGRETDFEQTLCLLGESLFEIPRQLELPQYGHWTSKTFLDLAARCAKADTEAMLELAEYFDSLGDHTFYQCAANFWRYRAFRYGNPRAEAWKRSWMQAHPWQRIPVILPANLKRSVDGDQLRALGFLFFDPQRPYTLEGVDENGVVLASSWCDYDPPDEDGFGGEDYYDWWYLDEYLNPIPGIRCIESCSNRDRGYLVKDWFDTRYAKAVEALQKK